MLRKCIGEQNIWVHTGYMVTLLNCDPIELSILDDYFLLSTYALVIEHNYCQFKVIYRWFTYSKLWFSTVWHRLPEVESPAEAAVVRGRSGKWWWTIGTMGFLGYPIFELWSQENMWDFERFRPDFNHQIGLEWYLQQQILTSKV